MSGGEAEAETAAIAPTVDALQDARIPQALRRPRGEQGRWKPVHGGALDGDGLPRAREKRQELTPGRMRASYLHVTRKEITPEKWGSIIRRAYRDATRKGNKLEHARIREMGRTFLARWLLGDPAKAEAPMLTLAQVLIGLSPDELKAAARQGLDETIETSGQASDVTTAASATLDEGLPPWAADPRPAVRPADAALGAGSGEPWVEEPAE